MKTIEMYILEVFEDGENKPPFRGETEALPHKILRYHSEKAKFPQKRRSYKRKSRLGLDHNNRP